MRVVGITGPTGAGKTTALRAVRELGGAVFDCDAIYKELLLRPGRMPEAIEGRFPGVMRGGVLDRRALAQRVFSDPNELRALSALTHPFVIDKTRRGLEEAARRGFKLAAVDAIGLFESGADGLCDETVFVTAPKEVRAGRIMARDGISRREALMRIEAQREDGYFEARCDHRLVNNFSDSEEFYRRCLEFFRRFLKNG